METHSTLRGRYIAAGIFIGLGVLLLLSNFGMVSFGAVVRTWWPSAVILWFVYRYFSRENRNTTWIIAVIVIMGIIQAERLDWLSGDMFDFWPLALVLIGIAILSHKPGEKRVKEETKWQDVSDNYVEANAVFTSVDRLVHSSAFIGGEANAVFGSTNLDLTMATPSTGDMFLKISAVFGEVVVRVPTEWNISFNITPVFGGAEDIRSLMNAAYQPSAPMLHITGSAVFGAVKLKN